ncbi:hypothetical protein LguiB_010190 [Lonicera macranthoides]
MKIAQIIRVDDHGTAALRLALVEEPSLLPHTLWPTGPGGSYHHTYAPMWLTNTSGKIGWVTIGQPDPFVKNPNPTEPVSLLGQPNKNPLLLGYHWVAQ